MKFYGGSTAYYGSAQAVSFYTGAPVSTLVPDTYNCSLGGRPYDIDWAQPFYRQYHRQLAPLIRTQADTSKLPGETSLDPNGLWRRSFEDWSLGAGQRYLDRDTSIDNGFWQSKGIDPFTNKWQITLLPELASQYSSANSNLFLVWANGYLYLSDGQSLKFTNNLVGVISWTTVTGTPADTVSSICTDGHTVYACYGAGGLYQTTAGASSASQLVTSSLAATAVCGYVNGRLMIGTGQSLYNITSAVAAVLPTPLLTTNNANSTWVGFAEGNNFLYAACNIGGKAYIYGTSVTSDGTALQPPSVQGQLPNGETCSAIFGYLGDIIIGSSLGVRWAATSSTGVSLGSLIPTPAAVNCLYGWQRWVYFGWTTYDTVSSGIGRIDLENFVIPGVLPAYCSDRMVTSQGTVTSAVLSPSGTGVVAISGLGVYVDDGDLVASGTVTSGYVLFGMTEPKIAALLDMQTVGPLTFGSYSALISADGGAFAGAGTASVGSPYPVTFDLDGTSAQRFEIQVTLNRDSGTPTAGPTFTRWTLRAYPAPRRAITWQLPLIFAESVVNTSGSQAAFDPLVELQAIELMAAVGQPVVYQEANESWQVYVTDVEFLADNITEDKHYMNGLCLVSLQSLPVPNLESV